MLRGTTLFTNKVTFQVLTNPIPLTVNSGTSYLVQTATQRGYTFKVPIGLSPSPTRSTDDFNAHILIKVFSIIEQECKIVKCFL